MKLTFPHEFDGKTKKKIMKEIRKSIAPPHQRLRERLSEVLTKTGKYRMGWIPEHKNAIINAILSAVAEEVEEMKKNIDLGQFDERQYGVGEVVEEKAKGYFYALDDLLRKLK